MDAQRTRGRGRAVAGAAVAGRARWNGRVGATRADGSAIELLDARAVTADVSRPPRDRASPAAVRAVLDNAASHARYFWRAAPALFTDAARLLTADEQSALLWLRNRPRGVSSPLQLRRAAVILLAHLGDRH